MAVPIPSCASRVRTVIRFLFSHEGRIARSTFWLGHLLLLALSAGGAVLVAAIVALGSVGRHADDGPGALGVAAIIVAFLVMGCGALGLAWSGICLGIRRYHDHGKPGIWVAIQFVPIIGAIWYLVETGFLRGTAGPNPYGADPLAPAGSATGAVNGAIAAPPPGAPTLDAPSVFQAPPASQAQPAMPPQVTRSPGGRPGWVVPVMVVLALPGLLVMIGSAAMAWRSHSWLAQATVVPGRVVGLEPVASTNTSTDASKTTSYKAVVAATTPEGKAIRVVDDWTVSPPPAIGDAREVAYDRSGPDYAVTVGFWSLYGWQSLIGGLTAVFVLPWLAATALVALLWKRRRQLSPRAFT